VKRFLIFAAAVMLSMSAEAGTKWHKTIDAAQKEAKTKKQLIFVDLFADWCGWCHRMEAEVFPSESFQNATDKMTLLRLNTEDKGEGTAFASRLSVSNLPTFLILTDDLTIAGVIKGYAPSAQFVKTLKETEEKYYEFAKRLDNDRMLDTKARFELYKELVGRHGYATAETRLTKFIADTKAPAPLREEANYLLALSQASLKKYTTAAKTIDTFLRQTPKGKMAEQSRFLKAQMYLEQNQLKQGLTELRQFKATYPNSELIASINQLIPQVESALKAK
jgi:thioredoxin-related protein